MSGASLESQIKHVEDNIKLRRKLGKDTSFEEGLVKAWRKYLPGGSKHHLRVEHSAHQQRLEMASSAPQSKSGRFE